MPSPTLVIGAPCWIDLYSSDTEKAAEFYGGLFGWTTETAARGVRRLLHVPEGRQARRRLHGERRPAGHAGRVDHVLDDRRRRAHRRRRQGEGRPGAHGADAGGGERIVRHHRRPGRRRHRRVAARTRSGLRDLERARRAEVVRAAHAQLRRERSTSTATCSGGTRTRTATRRTSATRRSAQARATSRGSWTRRSSCPKGAAPCGRSTSASTTWTQLSSASWSSAARSCRRPGHALRAVGTGRRPDRHGVQADGVAN